jgi:tetratricopeptide (TPR) repeat protein
MKALLFAFFVTLALSGAWEVVDTLPPCYTGLPFNLEIGNGRDQGYAYSSSDLPSWASLDNSKGAIAGSSHQAGAWPVNVKVADKSGKSISKQYILNIVDVTKSDVWANQNSNNYYDRKVSNPLRVVPSKADSTVTSKGSAFSYRFASENAVGSSVYAFLNLPDGLKGDSQTGAISGAFTVPGIYTLGIECADQSGSTAEGFVTIVVGDGSVKSSSAVAQVSSLNKVTVNNQVPFVYDVSAVQAQQTEADKALFAALAAVNAAKADLANRQSIYDSINIKLTAAEANADKAAAAAAKANTDRENAANRLTQTNNALTNAEDKLNLALLYQAGAQDNVKKAEKNLASAQSKFNDASAALAAAEKALQNAQATLNAKKLAEAQANTNLQNAQKDYNRANEDFNDAKKKLNNAQEAQQAAQDDLTRATNDLSLAQQAYDQANHQLKEATIQLASAEAARQASLRVLQDASAANQKATSNLGAAEWNLNQAVAALNVANAAKDAADRTSALVIANGSPQTSVKVDSTAVFGTCNSN